MHPPPISRGGWIRGQKHALNGGVVARTHQSVTRELASSMAAELRGENGRAVLPPELFLQPFAVVFHPQTRAYISDEIYPKGWAGLPVCSSCFLYLEATFSRLLSVCFLSATSLDPPWPGSWTDELWAAKASLCVSLSLNSIASSRSTQSHLARAPSEVQWPIKAPACFSGSLPAG